MKLPRPAKYLSISVLALGLAVGCASQPKEPAAETSAVTQAIDAASAAIAKAKSLDALWRDTGSFLDDAKDAAAKGDDAAAIKMADKARLEAENAVNQYYLEWAKSMMADLRAYGNLSAAQKATLNDAAKAIANAEGKRAYDMLAAMKAELDAASIQYTVVKGDSLWGISGKREVYNNPYQWPLIYKSNSNKIKDPDLIYPGQNFSINRNPSASEVDAAVNHAKTRGAWSLGEVEESDQQYLGGLRVR